MPGTSRFSPSGSRARRAGGGGRVSVDAVRRGERARAPGRRARNSCRPFSIVEPVAMQARSSSRQAGGNRPPCVATPTSATVGSNGKRLRDVGDDRQPSSSPRPASSRGSRRRRRAGSAGRRASSCRSAGRRRSPRRGSAAAAQPADAETRLLGRHLDAVDERRRPGTGPRRAAGCRRDRRGRRAARRQQPAAMPRPDSIMQPSITPRPSARAACAIRIASRIPPDFASLMLIPCAISRAARDVGERVAVLVDVDRDRRRRSELRPPSSPAGSGCSQYSTPSSASCGSASSASSSDHHSLTSTCSGRSVTRADGADALDVEAVAAAELELEPAEARRRRARRGAPCRPGRRARPSTRSAGPLRGSPSRRQAGTPSSFPCRSCSAASSAAFAACSPGISASRAPISSSANGSSPTRSPCSSTNASADSAVSS